MDAGRLGRDALGLHSTIRFGEDAGLVAAVAEYVAARQVALYRDTADFEPRHAVEVQEEALRRIMVGLSAR